MHRVFSLVQEEQFDPYHLCIIFTRSCSPCSPCSSKQYWVLSAHTSARSDQTCWTKYFSCSCKTCLIKIGKILLILRDHMLWFESVGNTTFDRIYIGSNLFSPFFFSFRSSVKRRKVCLQVVREKIVSCFESLDPLITYY